LAGANLAGADLTDAYLAGANLAGADLTGANGLLPDGLRPLQILGTRYPLIVRTPGIIQIGCVSHPVAWWLEHYRALGRQEGYTAKQIAEYRGYIALARHWMKLYKILNPEAQIAK